MRVVKRRSAAILAGLPLVAALATPIPAAADPPGTAPPYGPGPSGTRQIEYHGVRLRVPAGWPVIDLARHPETCARVDRHAVYLGTPSDRADCPARILGRTETISLRPDDTGVAPETATLPRSVPEAAGHAASWRLTRANVTLSVTYGAAPRRLGTVLAGVRVTPAEATGTRDPAPAAAPGAVRTTVPGEVTGRGFDACQAPTSATMDAWRSSSPYRAIGVYIGGGDLGCPDQPNLSPSWVHRQSGHGWHIFPLYVGRQAPCSDQPYRITKGKAAGQGRQDARDAVAQAKKYGMARGTIITNDMEYYPRGGACTTAVLNYLSTWTDELNDNHYRSGVYSSRSAAIDDLVAARKAGTHRMPGTIDFAQWDNTATTLDDHIPSRYWVHHRMKQYRGAHNEKHGGVRINIDSDYLDVT